MDVEILNIKYTLTFPDGKQKEFSIELDQHTLKALPHTESKNADWMRLGFHQCPNCPFSEADHPQCPVAVNLAHPIEQFRDSLSYEKVNLKVEMLHRKYEMETTLQKALSSLLGIYMVSSGCTILDKLRPLVRFHLPVATLEETQYRALGMYLMAQFFVKREGGEPDWQLRDLRSIYEQIGIVNGAFLKRLQHHLEKDAGINAVVILNRFAENVVFSIDESALEELEKLFGAYLEA